jgi:iron complex outermembrane recepter protein
MRVISAPPRSHMNNRQEADANSGSHPAKAVRNLWVSLVNAGLRPVFSTCGKIPRILLAVFDVPTVCPGDSAHPGNTLGASMPHLPARVQHPHRRFPASVRVSLGAMVGMGLLIPSTFAATEVSRRGFDIPAGDAEVTLKQFAAQSGEQLLYSPDDVSGVRTHAVHGEFTPLGALEHMLEGTSLKARQDGMTKAIAITAITAPHVAPQSTAPAESSRTRQPQNLSEEPPKNMKRKNPLALITGWVALALAPNQEVRAADSALGSGEVQTLGSISGQVSNVATGNLLEGAKIEIPELRLTALTDNTGSFVFTRVPEGTYDVVASYIGLDSIRTKLTIDRGRRAVRNFDLTTGIYVLQEFKVNGEREGAAAAITAQRNAENVKNVVAMESFGNLPNMSSGEVAIRLPGVTGALDPEGNVTDLGVRGMGPGLNSVTIDGSLAANQSAHQRLFRMQHFPGAMYEQVELIKGHTPDKEASSLGGTTNFKTRSPLNMKEKRRIAYNFGIRTAPSFTDQTPLREEKRSHPLLNLTYQEAFSVFGGERNFGVALNLFYSENASGYFRTNRDFQNTTGTPAYVWDYSTTDQSNNRKQKSANVKFEWRLSPTTKFTLNGIDNIGYEPMIRLYTTRAFTAQTVGTTGNAGIVPGYTDLITEVRAMPNSIIDVTSSRNEFFTRLRHWDFGLEHQLGRLELNVNATYSYVNVNNNPNDGGTLINRISNVGWILDRTASDRYPRFVQTAGPDFTNPANYRPTTIQLPDTQLYNIIKAVRGDARYRLGTRIPVSFKAGFRINENAFQTNAIPRRWNYIGATAIAPEPSFVTWDSLHTGRAIPQWESTSHLRNQTPVVPGLWEEDVYFREAANFTGRRPVAETVTAGYVMAQGKLGNSGVLARTSYLTGVRTERTETEGSGYVRARVLSTAAERRIDPAAAARRDYENNWTEDKAAYTKSFPSAHLTHDITSSVKARLSWATSFGRPPMTNFTPNETPNETSQTLTINNAGLRPQTAESWDATLEYYFEPVGNLSVGWFHKTIKDYIVDGYIIGTVGTGIDNGFNGEYDGFSLRSSVNAGTAVVQGWEASYQQQFTFLPGLLKGLGVWGNYTLLDTHGDFGGTTTLSNGQVEGFIPRTGNAGLSWRHRGFSSRILVNYTSDYITTYSAPSSGLNLYRFKRTIVNLGLAYQLRPSVTLTCDIANIFNEPQALYRGIPERINTYSIPGVTVTFGVSGRF